MKKIKIIVFITIIIILLVGIIYLVYRINEKKLIQNMKTYDVEVYSEKYISNIEKYDVIDDVKLNTNSLGERIYKYHYRDNKGKKKKKYIEINVIDSTSPLIWLGENYNVQVGSSDNLKDVILCGDNYDKNPYCVIQGKYDLNTLGSYKLKYLAVDSSNNKTEQDFTLNVVKPSNYEYQETLFEDIYSNYKNNNTEIGVDISAWQKDIDFVKLKQANVTFVMIRLGYQEDIKGNLILDDYFKKNIEEALKNNMKVGIYFYSKASSVKEVIEQVQFVYKNIKKYNVTLPVVFDWEIYSKFNSLNISLMDLNNLADVFIKKIEGYGYKGAIYGSKNYLEKIWYNQSGDVWLAHYIDKTNYNGKYFMWQICNDGKIDGIDGYVDIDILYNN